MRARIPALAVVALSLAACDNEKCDALKVDRGMTRAALLALCGEPSALTNSGSTAVIMSMSTLTTEQSHLSSGAARRRIRSDQRTSPLLFLL